MKKYNDGFTLIELMIVLSIMAVLLLVAVPNFSDSVEKNRVEAYRTDLLRDFAFARQEAINRNTPVTVCKSANGSDCTSAGNWDQGWIIFVDNSSATLVGSTLGANSNVEGVVDGDDEVLRVHGAINSSDQLEGTDNYVQFNVRGWLSLPSGSANTDMTLTACSKSDDYIRGVLILASGRAIASRIDGNGDSYVKTGTALACT